MPSVKQYQAVQFLGFSKGLNTHADSSRLEDDELAQSLNFKLGPRGEMQLRSGYSRYDQNLGAEVHWIFSWRSFAGQDHIIVVAGSEILEDTFDGVFSSSGISLNQVATISKWGVGFASAFKKAYVSAKTSDNVWGFDGTTWAAVPTIPIAKHLHFRHDRMYAINTDDNPSRVFVSSFNQPETFPVENFIDVDPDDGYEINASQVFGDDLMLFKDNAIWKLSGREPSSFATYRVDNHRGTVSPKTVAQLRGRLIFYDRDTGIWAFDGANFELLSEPINDDILDRQDYDNAFLATAYVSDDRYHISIARDPSLVLEPTIKTYTYFADTGGWTEADTGFSAAAYYLDTQFLGLHGVDGIYNPDFTTQLIPPSAVPLVGKFRTAWVRVGGPGFKARIRRIEMTIKALASTDFTVRMYRDFDPVVPYVERTFSGGAVPYAIGLPDEERVVASDGWGNRLHAVQFEVETNDAPFQLNDMTVFYTGGVDVRGER